MVRDAVGFVERVLGTRCVSGAGARRSAGPGPGIAPVRRRGRTASANWGLGTNTAPTACACVPSATPISSTTDPTGLAGNVTGSVRKRCDLRAPPVVLVIVMVIVIVKMALLGIKVMSCACSEKKGIT